MTSSHRLWLLPVLTVALAACNGKALTPVGPGETVMRPNTMSIKVVSQELTLRSADGSALTDVAVLIGGKQYPITNGIVAVPESVLAEARKAGGLVILGKGFVPTLVALDGSISDIVLAPLASGTASTLGKAGGTLAMTGEFVRVGLANGILASDDTRLTVGFYTPGLNAAAQSSFNSEIERLTKARNGAASTCEAPLACPPVLQSLGIAVSVDGQLGQGSVDVQLDLGKLLRGWDGVSTPPWETAPNSWSAQDKANALAAARILKTYQNIDMTGDPTWRASLHDSFGLKLDGQMLTFPVAVGGKSTTDGLTKVEVSGIAVLGARLEITVLSAVSGALPKGALSDSLVDPRRLPEQLGTTPLDPKLPTDTSALVPPPNNTLQTNLKVEGLPFTPTNGPSLVLADMGLKLKGDKLDTLVTTGGRVLTAGTGIPAEVTRKLGSGIETAATVVSDLGASLVSANTGNLVSDNGGNLIANNAGSISGFPYLAFKSAVAGFKLLDIVIPTPQYERNNPVGLKEYLWPLQLKCRAIKVGGEPLTDWVSNDADGRFTISLVGGSPLVFFIETVGQGLAGEGEVRSYAMAFAPGKRETSIQMDSSTAMVAASTMHLWRYIPPEINRLEGLADAKEALFEQKQDQLDGIDSNDKDAKKVEEQIRGAMAQIASSLGIIDPRLEELKAALGAFNPLRYPEDTQKTWLILPNDRAQEVARADTLRKTYDPLYALSKDRGLIQPVSFKAINPDSPSATLVE